MGVCEVKDLVSIREIDYQGRNSDHACKKGHGEKASVLMRKVWVCLSSNRVLKVCMRLVCGYYEVGIQKCYWTPNNLFTHMKERDKKKNKCRYNVEA